MGEKVKNLSLSSIISYEIQSMKKTSIKMLLLVFFLANLILVAIAMINRIYQIPFAQLTGDPVALAEMHPLSGVLSNLGVILWCVATSICAFSATLLRTVGTKKLFLFLLYSSLLSAYLLFDDFFQFHEDISSSIGLNQKVTYILLATAVITYLIYFKKILLQTNIIPFFIALAFLFLSVFIDTIVYKVFGSQLGDWLYFIEDGAKWIGIVFWCYYFYNTSYQFILKNIRITSTTH